MAKEDHVRQIKRGPKVWNSWREKNPDIVPDLSDMDLRREPLTSANLSGADLHKAILNGKTLSETELHRANLSAAELQGANLSAAELHGANLSGANLSGADLRSAGLHGANLSGANLSGADLQRAILGDANLSATTLTGVNLREADLHKAILNGADLSDADLRKATLLKADLRGALLRGASLTGADLRDTIFCSADLSDALLIGADLNSANFAEVNFCGADLRRATLIDSQFDGADLTSAKLWETQRSGWSIKGVICQRAFWDRDGKEATEYEDGAFERIYAEKPRIVLRYAGGMSPVDLAMLPLIIERLQAEHPDSSLHIRSVQDDGSGATVTITVEDVADRSDEAFARDVQMMRGDLATLQQRLHQEERLRLDAEAGYRAMVQDVLPKLLEKALPKMETHIGQITGPTSIGSTSMSGDTFNNHGQAGAFGSNPRAHDMTIQQVQNQATLDLPRLVEELARLRAAMKEAEGNDEQDEAIGAVAAAEKAAGKGDSSAVLGHLKTAGEWTLGIATQIGVPTAIEAIKRAM